MGLRARLASSNSHSVPERYRLPSGFCSSTGVPIRLATFRRKNSLLDRPCLGLGLVGSGRFVFFPNFSTLRRLKGQNSSDVDQIIRNHAQSNPSLHAIIAAISTSIQTMPSFEHTDPAFATGSPCLSLTEPSRLL